MMKQMYKAGLLAAVLALTSPFYCQTSTQDASAFATHMRKAIDELRAKKPDLAIPEFRAAVELNPRSVEAQANLGVLLYFQGKQAEAKPHLRAAIELQPTLAKIQGLLGLAELRTGELSQGRKDLETSFPEIQEIPFKVQVGLELVSLYTQAGELEAMPPVLAQLRKAAPDNPEVLYATYRAYADLSGQAMLSLSVVAPDSAQMHQLLGHEALKQGNTNGAIAEMRKAIALDPALPGIYFELAEVLHTSDDQQVKKQAEEEYRKALAANPMDEKSVLRLADIDEANGRTDAAIAEYQKAADLQPGDADPKLGLAKILIERNDTDKALPLLEAAVKADPSNAVAHYRLATLYRKVGRNDEAKREVEIYKGLKDAKEKMRAVYKVLLIQPQQIRADQPDEK